MPVPSVSMSTVPRCAAAGAEAHLGEPGGVGVVADDQRAAERVGEERVGGRADPRAVDVGGGLDHAVEDHGGKADARATARAAARRRARPSPWRPPSASRAAASRRARAGSSARPSSSRRSAALMPRAAHVDADHLHASAPSARAGRSTRSRPHVTCDAGGSVFGRTRACETAAMQLGMIGLGRMGANIVRRLMRDGHECVVYDVNEAAIAQLEGEGALGARSLEEFAAKLTTPRAAWIMVPAALAAATVERARRALRARRHHHRRRQQLLPRRHRPRRASCARARHPLRRRRHERRRVRARARLLPDDRRRGPHRRAPRPDLPHARAGRRHGAPRTPGRSGPAERRPSTATCTAAATARATS